MLDVASGRAPHLSNGTDVLCDIMLQPYGEPYQTSFQVNPPTILRRGISRRRETAA